MSLNNIQNFIGDVLCETRTFCQAEIIIKSSVKMTLAFIKTSVRSTTCYSSLSAVLELMVSTEHIPEKCQMHFLLSAYQLFCKVTHGATRQRQNRGDCEWTFWFQFRFYYMLSTVLPSILGLGQVSSSLKQSY